LTDYVEDFAPACVSDPSPLIVDDEEKLWVGKVPPMKIALVTDAWHPQVNGVVRTLDTVTRNLRELGHEVMVISPDQFRSVPMPTYSEIRLAFTRPGTVGRMIAEFAPDAVHLATEGPLCLAARNWLRRRRLEFTTAYHTHFPQYVATRGYLPESWIWSYIRWFHRPARNVMVSTESVRAQLRQHGIGHLHHWGRGVDLGNFSADAPVPALYADLPRPIQLYVGRVAVEKNIEAFLRSDHPGSKVVVGDGPALSELRARYPQAHFVGRQSGRALAGYYAGADVFVFPSVTDTFGLVIIEALACGTPVAGYPVTGPIDILTDRVGAIDQDLTAAIGRALRCDPAACTAHAAEFTWEASTAQFLFGLSAVDTDHAEQVKKARISFPRLRQRTRVHSA
jgi:glycosyltransferase involved in cell wall biosynthesis